MPFLNVRCVTWNVGDEAPPQSDFRQLLGLTADKPPDVIGVALQEVVSDDAWRKALIAHVHPSGYVLIKSRNCWAIWMYVFVRRNLLPAITNIESESTPSGYAGVMGNKGGVSVRFEICGVNLILLSCHFTAHKEKQRDRLNDYLDIISHQSFRDEDVNVILDHDYVFWMGDLNFRLENITKNEAEQLIVENRLSELLKHDQLNIMKDKKLIFQDFNEGEITFPPTFKFDKGTEIYDSSKKRRIPAWTDRILYMAHRDYAIDHHLNVNPNLNRRSPSPSRHTPVRGPPSEVERKYPSGSFKTKIAHHPEIVLVEYTSLSEYRHSDHRPVVGTFQFAVPSRWFSLPIEFVEPKIDRHPRSEDLKFVYSISDPPTLLNLSDADPILLSRPRLPNQSMAQLTVLTALNKALMEKTEESGPSLTPSAMQVAMFDWIGLYPADFANLEDDYLTYVYAPPATTSGCHGSSSTGTSPTNNNTSAGGGSGRSSSPAHISCHTGRVSARSISGLKNQSIVLVYWSRKKKCPQGYSTPIMICD